MELCEWNPTLNEPALCSRHVRPTDCTNKAEWAMGRMGDWHLCYSCAALPAFKRFKMRTNLITGAKVLINREW